MFDWTSTTQLAADRRRSLAVAASGHRRPRLARLARGGRSTRPAP